MKLKDLLVEIKDIQNIPGKGNIEFETTSTDSHDNQVDMVTYCFLPGGGYESPWIGYCEYSIYKHTISIQMIEVRAGYRRHGIATKLLEKIKKENPGMKIDYGYSTDDGTELVQSLKKK